jgi:hypothetical protein
MAKTWTDKDIYSLNAAHWITHLAHYPGLEAVRPFRESWIQAVVRFGKAVDEGDGVASAGRHLERLAARISRTKVNLAAVSAAMGESTVTPEQTLAEAGISSSRQAKYQRKMSALLGRGGA